ncbi:DUF402 domain-containing protein [Streptomyces noursei]|uniref:DUF402 domain-containing protein n=1 Tax=Streptomyces noursei TaxID=1971 RepID=UPI00332D9CD5
MPESPEPPHPAPPAAAPRRFAPGEVILRREVLDGRVWLMYPVRVIEDHGDLLAVHLAHGTPLTYGPGPFRWGPHPWQRVGDTWRSEDVVQLQRPGDGYAVWTRHHEGVFAGWYVNFQQPFRRTPAGFDTLDQELDLWIPADGGPHRWKDRREFEDRAASGGFTPDEAAAVRAEAARVTALVDRGTPWWTRRWSDWRPDPTWTAPPRAALPRPDRSGT